MYILGLKTKRIGQNSVVISQNVHRKTLASFMNVRSVTSVAQKYRALDWKTTTTPELQEHQQLMQKLQQQQVVLEDGHDGPASNPNHICWVISYIYTQK